MAVLKNRAKMSTSTTGTGTITLGSAESGYQTFADAGVANADVVRYVIEDGNNWEIGTGTYTATGTTLSRTVSESSNADAAINLSGSATVFIGATAEDIPDLYADNYDGTSTAPSATGSNAIALGRNATALGEDCVAIGNDANAQASFGSAGFSMGEQADASAGSLSLGNFSSASGSASTAIGTSAQATSGNASALGNDARGAGSDAVALGKSRAGGTDSFAAQIGSNSSSYGATGNNATAVGVLTKATGLDFVFGRSSIASGGSGSLSLGMDNTSSAGGAVTLGKGNTSSHTDAVVIGQGASSSAADEITLGHTDQTVRISSSYTLPTSDGTNGQVLTTNGSGAVTFADAGGGDPDLYRDNASSPTTPVASAANGVAIGNGASSGGSSSSGVAIGFNATVGAGTGGVAIGESYVGNSDAVAFAMNSTSSSYGALGARSVAGAGMAKASGSGSIALGYGSQSTNSISVAIGQNATATAANALALGYNSSATTADSISLGGSATSVKVSGAYTLPTSDGTNGQVLTTDGSGAVTFADAGGGGGSSYNLIAENYTNGTAPTVTGNDSIGIGDNATASGVDSYAIGYNATAAGAQSISLGGLANVSSGSSNGGAALGYFATVGAGESGVALGRSYTSGNHAFAAAIATNSSSYGASGSNSIAGGDYNKATATDSLCWGGDSNVAQSGAKSAVVGGWQNNCSGAYSFISGGRGNKITSGSYSRAGGLQADVNGTGIDTWSSGRFSSDGDAQTSKRVLIANTTDATATVLGTQNINSLAANQVTLPNNSAFAFHGTIVARQQAADGTACAAWKVEGLIRREANAGTTVLVNSATTVLDNTPSWGMALSADTTNGCLKIEATGAAATDIRWVATIHTSEVTYA